MRVETVGGNRHGADREAGQGIKDGLAAPVFSKISTHFAGSDELLASHVFGDLRVETRQGLLAARRPVLALKQHHEIVAANMSAEVDPRIGDAGQRLRQQDDDVVAAAVAEDVVERLEVVDVEIAGVEGDSAFKQAIDVFVDGDVSR